MESISLEFHEGEVTAIVGDNGAGKSTFIKMLCGAHKKDSGTILWQGEPVEISNPHDARQLGIETLYQNLALVDDLDACQNAFLGREVLHSGIGRFIGLLDKKTMWRDAHNLIRSLNVKLPSARQKVMNLSGGQRQSLAIVRAILFDAKLIIMDEPMAALGVDESRKVMTLIGALKTKGHCVLIISHNLDHVFSIADKIAVLKNGRLMGVRMVEKTSKSEIVSLILGVAS